MARTAKTTASLAAARERGGSSGNASDSFSAVSLTALFEVKAAALAAADVPPRVGLR